MRLNNGLNTLIIIERLDAKVLTLWVKCGSNIGMVDDLPGVLSQNLEGHGMSNSFDNANPIATFLMGV
jgi:hypothetical protein